MILERGEDISPSTDLIWEEIHELPLANEPSLLEMAAVGFELPADMPELLSPIVAVVVGQLLAYHVVLHKGLNPDTPPARGRVTRTW